MRNKILIVVVLMLLSVFVSASSNDIIVIVQDSAPVMYKEYIIEIPTAVVVPTLSRSLLMADDDIVTYDDYDELGYDELDYDGLSYDEILDNSIVSNNNVILDDQVTFREIDYDGDYDSRVTSNDDIETITEIVRPVKYSSELAMEGSITPPDVLYNINVEGIYNDYFYLAVGEHYDYDWDFADPSEPSAGWDLYSAYDDTFVISSDQTLPAFSNVYDEYMSWSTNWEVTGPMSAGTSSFSDKSGDYLTATLQNESIEVKEIYNLPPYSSSWFQKGYIIKNVGGFTLTNVKFIQLFDISVGGTENDADDVGNYNYAQDSITLSDSINTYEAGVSDSKIGTISVYPNIQSSYHSVGNATYIYRDLMQNMQLDNIDNYNGDDPLDKESYSSVAYQFNIGDLLPGEEKEIIFTIKVNMDLDREMADLLPVNLTFFKQNGLVNVSFDLLNNGDLAASNFKIKLYEISPENNILQEEIIRVDESIDVSESKTFSRLLDLDANNELYISVDTDYSVLESDESNNYIRQTYYGANVFVESNTTLSLIDNLFVDYVKSNLGKYNIVNDKALADYVITIGYNNYDTLSQYDWGMNDGNIKFYDNYENLPYNGLINSFEDNGIVNIVIMGNAIEGLVSSLREFDYDELENNKDNYIDRTNINALGTFDFFNLAENKINYMNNNNDFLEIVNLGLLGGYKFTQELVKTPDLMTLRLKHIEPQHSYSFKQLLDSIYDELDLGYTELPVVISRGLWSNLTTWENLGNKLASAGRDVWMIELTGGPYQDCATCSDYTFDDLVDNYWPALIGGVEAYTGKNKIQYVGFSNGGRIALSSLDKYNDIGKVNAGKYWDGDSWEDSSMSANVVDHLVAVAVPGAFEGTSPMKGMLSVFGDESIEEIREQNLLHISAVKAVTVGLLESMLGPEGNISTNLLSRYIDFAKGSSDVQPGQNISVNQFTAIRGYIGDEVISDGVVTKDDMDSIFDGVSSINKTYYKVLGSHFDFGSVLSVADRKVTMNIIENELNNKEISSLHKCFNLIEPGWWCP